MEAGLQARIEKWSVPEPNTGCWLWLGSANTSGYPRLTVLKNRRITVARLILGEPPGLCACHRCDVRACVNPAHLFVGTQVENTRDRDRKKRHWAMAGEEHGMAKLSLQQVTEVDRLLRIRMPHREIAARFGVHYRTVAKISSGERWSSATGRGQRSKAHR